MAPKRAKPSNPPGTPPAKRTRQARNNSPLMKLDSGGKPVRIAQKPQPSDETGTPANGVSQAAANVRAAALLTPAWPPWQPGKDAIKFPPKKAKYPPSARPENSLVLAPPTERPKGIPKPPPGKRTFWATLVGPETLKVNKKTKTNNTIAKSGPRTVASQTTVTKATRASRSTQHTASQKPSTNATSIEFLATSDDSEKKVIGNIATLETVATTKVATEPTESANKSLVEGKSSSLGKNVSVITKKPIRSVKKGTAKKSLGGITKKKAAPRKKAAAVKTTTTKVATKQSGATTKTVSIKAAPVTRMKTRTAASAAATAATLAIDHGAPTAVLAAAMPEATQAMTTSRTAKPIGDTKHARVTDVDVTTMKVPRKPTLKTKKAAVIEKQKPAAATSPLSPSKITKSPVLNRWQKAAATRKANAAKKAAEAAMKAAGSNAQDAAKLTIKLVLKNQEPLGGTSETRAKAGAATVNITTSRVSTRSMKAAAADDRQPTKALPRKAAPIKLKLVNNKSPKRVIRRSSSTSEQPKLLDEIINPVTQLLSRVGSPAREENEDSAISEFLHDLRGSQEAKLAQEVGMRQAKETEENQAQEDNAVEAVEVIAAPKATAQPAPRQAADDSDTLLMGDVLASQATSEEAVVEKTSVVAAEESAAQPDPEAEATPSSAPEVTPNAAKPRARRGPLRVRLNGKEYRIERKNTANNPPPAPTVADLSVISEDPIAEQAAEAAYEGQAIKVPPAAATTQAGRGQFKMKRSGKKSTSPRKGATSKSPQAATMTHQPPVPPQTPSKPSFFELLNSSVYDQKIDEITLAAAEWMKTVPRCVLKDNMLYRCKDDRWTYNSDYWPSGVYPMNPGLIKASMPRLYCSPELKILEDMSAAFMGCLFTTNKKKSRDLKAIFKFQWPRKQYEENWLPEDDDELPTENATANTTNDDYGSIDNVVNNGKGDGDPMAPLNPHRDALQWSNSVSPEDFEQRKALRERVRQHISSVNQPRKAQPPSAGPPIQRGQPVAEHDDDDLLDFEDIEKQGEMLTQTAPDAPIFDVPSWDFIQQYLSRENPDPCLHEYNAAVNQPRWLTVEELNRPQIKELLWKVDDLVAHAATLVVETDQRNRARMKMWKLARDISKSQKI